MHGVLNDRLRAEAKRASRARDAERLASGEVGPMDLARENGILSRAELRGARLVRSGRVVLDVPRKLPV